MATNKSASYEARLKNSRDLAFKISQYSRYQPTSEEIKKENLPGFIENVETAMTDFRNSIGALSTERKENNLLFSEMVLSARNIRSEIGELKGTDSIQYEQVNSIVKLITGENISLHNMRKKENIKILKEGEPVPENSSVSQLDQKSMLGNCRALTGLLRSFTFYVPEDESLRIASLETLEAKLTGSLDRITQKEAAYTNQRSRIISYFDEKNGLLDRAKRAKMHVRRKYGHKSPEYKALVNKKY